MNTSKTIFILSLRMLALVACAGVLSVLASEASAQPWLHSLMENNYEGTGTCLACHGEGGLVGQHIEADVMATVHWTWLKTNTPPGHQQVMGKRNVINNYCVAVPSNEPRCTSCHAGYGWRDNSFDFNNPTNIDCLVCHDTTGTYKKTPTGAGMPDSSVDLAYVAMNAGKTSRATCGACHFYGGGGDAVKHGDLDSTLTNPTRSVDVHMGVDGANMTCTECHMSTEPGSTSHDLVGSRYSKNGPDNWLCEDCHSPTPHWNVADGIYYNAHTGRVSCQACHIPFFARGGHATKMTWDWSTAGEKNPDGSILIIEDGHGNPIYDTRKGSFTWASNVAPEYVWFDGNVIYTTLDDVIDANEITPINQLQGSKSQGRARIIPVKRFTGIQPFDPVNNTLAVPHLFPSGPTDTDAYWKSYNWTNAIAAGMAAVGRPFSGQVGWANTEMYWVQNHMVAPREEALTCTDCHSADGRIPFEQLGYEPERAARLHDLNMIVGPDHTGRFGTNFVGAAACVQCHSGIAEEVMGSVHYTWRTPNSKLAYPGGGSHGMVDRFCALVGANAMVNYFADLGEHKGSSACGKCHIGEGLPFPDPATGQFTQAQRDGLDCLICHASEGNYDMNGDGLYDADDAEATHRLLTTNSVTGRRVWFQDRSLRAAESVGLRIGATECLRCHEHGQAAPDYKRGTPFTPENDIHAAAGMICTDCHDVDHHKIARGSRVSDMHAWERQDVEVDCSNCHDGNAPHLDPAHAAYNEHVSLIACETCHIPWTSGASRRVWASTFGVTNGPEANIPILDPETGMYEPHSVYSDDYASRPAYRWFNGNVSMLAEPIDDVDAWDFRVATKATPGAKIYPFRPIISGMVMDRRGFGYDPNFNTNFTMAAAMDAMAGPLMQMGFMRPEGLTAAERAVLSQFPNLLNFDKEHYVHTGNIQEAVNIALGRLGVMMSGQDAWGLPVEQLSAIGSNFWSGEVLGLDLPNNPMDPTYNPTAPPTEVTGSFISLNHSIKRDEALHCEDCHAPAGVMDFKALSYSAQETEHLQMLMQKVQLLRSESIEEGLLVRWACVPGRAYQLESTPDLQNIPWTPAGPVTNSVGPWMEHLIPESELGTEPQNFFRVMQVAP